MADDRAIEIYRSLRAATDKYVYFLLAAAGACVAFAINQTSNAPLSWFQIPLGAALLCWALSFYCGARYVEAVSGLLYENYEFVRMQSGEHPNLPPADRTLAASILNGMAETSKRASKRAVWQFRFLLAGAALFVCWHVIEMYLRAVEIETLVEPSTAASHVSAGPCGRRQYVISALGATQAPNMGRGHG
jgi:hypothetical protein